MVKSNVNRDEARQNVVGSGGTDSRSTDKLSTTDGITRRVLGTGRRYRLQGQASNWTQAQTMSLDTNRSQPKHDGRKGIEVSCRRRPYGPATSAEYSVKMRTLRDSGHLRVWLVGLSILELLLTLPARAALACAFSSLRPSRAYTPWAED